MRRSLLMFSAVLVGCSGGTFNDPDAAGLPIDGGVSWVDAEPIAPKQDARVPTPNWDAFFAKDPPPKYCGPDGGGQAPPLPGGTPECPSDKNREGCPCTTKGATAACWPGLRINRNHGICKDGVAECKLVDEVSLAWGPCTGYVLPKPGATLGADACGCFSKGKWQIDNLSPCSFTYPNSEVWMVSTYMDSKGQPQCPDASPTAPPPPAPQPGQPWSKNRLNVDCAGQFKLCYTIKAGDAANPRATDCTVAQSCTEAWYPKENTTQDLPDLPAWVAKDSACGGQFHTVGGYGEMSVQGLSVECEKVDNGSGQPRVFSHVRYCPAKCSKDPSLPECKDCGNGGSGDF